METLEEFVERLRALVGCYSHPCKSGNYSLKKFNTDIKKKMGVFSWVSQLKTIGVFRVDTYKKHADKAGVSELADGEDLNMHWGQPGVFFFVKKGSTCDDWQKALRVLKAIIVLI